MKKPTKAKPTKKVMVKPPVEEGAITNRFLTKKNTSLLSREIKSIEKRHGIVRPADLLESARAKVSPIHDLFQWDNEIAGERWRVQQARFYISTVRVQMENKNMNAYTNVKVQINGTEERGYVSTARVLSEEGLYNQTIQEALREINHWRNKYADYQELTSVIDDDKLHELAG